MCVNLRAGALSFWNFASPLAFFIWSGKWKFDGTASFFKCLFLIYSDCGRLEG